MRDSLREVCYFAYCSLQVVLGHDIQRNSISRFDLFITMNCLLCTVEKPHADRSLSEAREKVKQQKDSKTLPGLGRIQDHKRKRFNKRGQSPRLCFGFCF